MSLKGECFMDSLVLRQVCEKDCKILYEWKNDELCRYNSLNSEKLDYHSHCVWFQHKLAADDSLFFIVVLENIPIGQIRLDLEGPVGKINYSVDKAYRGQGYGGKIVKLAEEKAMEHGIDKLIAVVKTENLPSIKIFEKLGYSGEEKDDLIIYSKKRA
jgi:RimJ/RimL family protein N-acetyltransferase